MRLSLCRFFVSFSFLFLSIICPVSFAQSDSTKNTHQLQPHHMFALVGMPEVANIALLTDMPAISDSDTNKIGDSYIVKGKRYYPFSSVFKGFTQKGIASWYNVASNFGTQTASGEKLNQYAMTAASKTLPMNTKVRVTDLKTDKSVVVKITDRGPYIKGRIIDLTQAAARKLGYINAGIAHVKVTVLS